MDLKSAIQRVLFTAFFLIFGSCVSNAQNVIIDFESGKLDTTLITVSTVGTFGFLPGIKPFPHFGSTMAFGFGRSTCAASCFEGYATNLVINLHFPRHVAGISFKEMEWFSNWGSSGAVYIDGHLIPQSFFSRLPQNDWIQDPTYRTHTLNIDSMCSTIEFHVGDITNASEVYIDDIVLEIPTGVEIGIDDSRIPRFFVLSQNYPNPFNPFTTIRYGSPAKSHVTLAVYNTLGQLVATLVQGEQVAGYHEVRFDASGMASGVYFYRMQAGAYVETRKLLLLR